MQNCKALSTPTPCGTVVPTLEHLPKSDDEKEESKNFPMMQILGHLNWLQMMTFLEMTYPLKVVAQFNLRHGRVAHIWVKNMLRYLASHTYDYRMIRYKGHMNMDAFADSNHLKNKSDCRPISGGVIRLGGNIIRHPCTREKHVTHSSPESELYAVDLIARELRSCIFLVEAIGGPKQHSAPLYVDCAAAIHWAINPVHAKSNAHMHARYFYVRELHQEKVLKVMKVASESNIADLMVTYKTESNFHFLTRCAKLGFEPEQAKTTKHMSS